MRLFLILAGHATEMTDLVRALKTNGHEVVYWVGLSGGDEKNFPEIIFHSDYDAARNIPPAGIDTRSFLPPGQELIKKLYHTESMVMSLLTKTEPWLTVEQRKRRYYEMLRYWHGLLLKYRPGAVIFPISPSQAYNYLIYALAKLLGIKTIMFYDAWVSDRTLLQTDFENSGERMSKEILKNLHESFTLDDLGVDLRDYYNRYHSPSVSDPSSSDFKRQRNQNLGLALWRRKFRIVRKALLSGRIVQTAIGYLRKRLGDNPQKEYRRLEKQPVLSKKFVYVPLHFQPERATLPLGDIFADQILMLEIISASLPEGWIAYVKEHPTQWWRRGINYTAYRPKGFYQKIASLANISLVPVKSDNYALAEYAQAVVTVTGTPGWEAIVRGKPAIIFGYPWYMDCPCVLRASDVETCSSAFRKIASGEFRINSQDVINYLKSLDNASFHIYIDDPEENISQLSKQQRSNNMIQAILAELKGEYNV